MAIFIMLNNFFHDFAVAVLFDTLAVMAFVFRTLQKHPEENYLVFARGLYRWLNKVIVASWAFVIVGGVVRTLAYEQYEWMESAGRGQIAALIVKHLLLVSFVVGGTILQIRVKKMLAQLNAKP